MRVGKGNFVGGDGSVGRWKNRALEREDCCLSGQYCSPAAQGSQGGLSGVCVGQGSVARREDRARRTVLTLAAQEEQLRRQAEDAAGRMDVHVSRTLRMLWQQHKQQVLKGCNYQLIRRNLNQGIVENQLSAFSSLS